MQISNQNSPSFGRIYIKEDALTREQYADSLDFAENLTKSRIYQQAHNEGVDVFIISDKNENPRAFFVEDETGKVFYQPKFPSKPIASLLSIEKIEKNLLEILDSDHNVTRELYNPNYVARTHIQGSICNAEPSEENPEHVWLV